MNSKVDPERSRRVKKSNYQTAARWLPRIGIFLAITSLSALISSLPVFGMINLFRGVAGIVFVSLIGLLIKSEISDDEDVGMTDWIVVVAIALLIGYFIYLA